jgi:predicted GNAT family acetyltransferase
MSGENVVRNNRAEGRFEMTLGEGKAAFIQYAEAGAGVLDLLHTEVPEEFEGKGVGSELVKGTFEILRAENLRMLPSCRFVAVYLQRHPEYQSLAASTASEE